METHSVVLNTGVTGAVAALRVSWEGTRIWAGKKSKPLSNRAPVARGLGLDAFSIFRAVLILGLALTFPGVLRAETSVAFPSTPSSGVTVRLISPLAQLPHFGFLPLRVVVENLTANDGTWDLNFQVGTRGVSSAVLATVHTVSAPAGQTRETWIYVPIAQAGFAMNASGGGGPTRLAAGRAIISKTATGTAVTRNMGGGATMIVEINESTGELKRQTTLPSGSGSSTNVTTPPPGRDVIFTIDPNGNVSTSTMPQRGATPKYTVVTAGGLTAPVVTITPTANGTKVTRVYGTNPRGLTEETEFNTTLGSVTITRTSPAGIVTRDPPRIIPAAPGNEVTFLIDRTTGDYTLQRQSSGGNAPAKFTVGFGGSAPTNLVAYRGKPGTYQFNVTGSISGTVWGTDVYTDDSSLAAAAVHAGVVAVGETKNVTVTILPGRTSYVSSTRNGISSGTYAQWDGSFSFIGGGRAVAPSIATAVGGGAGGAGAIRLAPISVSGSSPAPNGNPAPMPITAEITGPGFAAGVRVVLPNGTNGNPMRPFAVTAAQESNLRAALASEVRGAPNLSAVTLGQLPADWRLWSGFAGLILTADEFTTLDAARRGALHGWVGMGGQIYLVPATVGAPQTEKVGAGRIVTLSSPLPQMDAADLRTSLMIYGETPALPDRETLFLKNTPLGDELEKPSSDNAWIAIFLVVFAAVIGPVNLFAFAPRDKRHRLFWTTPALSLLGGIVLVAAIFLQDGIGGSGQRKALVVLLPGQNQAAVFQEQAAKTGFLLKRTFTLDDHAVLAPLAVQDMGQFRGPPDVSVARRSEGQGGGDWFQNRSRPAHLLRQLTPTRGRVERVGTAASGAPIVESSLATVLRNFVLKDEEGNSWSAEKIQPGERVTLKAESLRGGVNRLNLGGSRGLALAFDAATDSRAGGTWTAWGGETEVAPVATLSSLRWEQSSVAYVGVAEARSAASAAGGAR